MNQIGKWFEAVLGPLIGYLKIEGFGPFLAFAILVVGAIVIALILYHFSVFYRRLNNAISALQNCENEEEFYKNFESINGYFNNNSGLGVCWREFTETIIHPHVARPGGTDPIIRNTSRPGDFFDAEAAGFVTPTLRIMPNIFVGVGLFLTFAGLIAALSTATTAMSGGADQMQVALRDLLYTISAKFYTSLIALGVSIFLTIIFRILETKRSVLFKKLNDKIERGMHFVSVEEIAYSQLEEMKEQKIQLQQFNTDLAMKLGDHIETAVTSAMSPVVDKLSSMGENMGQSNIKAMQEIGDAIAKNVQGAAGESLGHLSDRLDNLTTVLGDMSSNLSKSTSEFENDIANALTSMKSGLEAMASDLQSNAAQTSDILSEKLEGLADSLSNAAENIKVSLEAGAGEVSGELERAIERLTEATDRSADKMGSAVDGINDAVKGIASSLEDASGQAGELAKARMEEAGASAANTFSEAGQKMSDALEVGMEELSTAMAGFEQSLGQASENMLKMNDELGNTSKVVSKTSSDLDSSVKALKEASGSVSGAISPALNAVESIQSAVRQMDEKVSSAASRVSEAVERLETEMRLSGESWEEHSKKFDGVNENLGAVFSKVNSQIEESQSRMRDFVIGVDGAFRNALAGLQEAVEELADERKAGRD
ncbi:anti-phage ZorAB system protein ZorA [Candidatus Puniceispirillum marinum]|uniref:Uncharacterized protein n=1 Tax=Puniceispirillum marinum (strain IMCC1322) TaxID=488538 RepID=D5BPD9_PUNMI|nr:anti-phage ZorAB system protein ZorA [Candidatus Puniceispirillum marinum]ADE38421.1 hypothetical protein SAR116_0178 [Candidatus Puniceispirillum marinum IMCC1322]